MIGQRERALSLYEEELAENDDPAFVNEVAWCCERTGHYDRAVELYEDIEDRTDIPKLKQHAINRIDQIQYHLNRQKDSNRGAVTYAY